MEATNSSLKQQLQELQEKLDSSQLREKLDITHSCLSQKICALDRQLAACKAELAKEAGEKDRIIAEMETFKGTF